MQLIHAIVALVAVSKATGSPMASSGITETTNMMLEKKEVKCFKECSPNPGLNLCDMTTSCTPIVGGKANFYCGCRHGYKPKDISPENAYRLPWVGQEGRVFVPPGVSCDVPCVDNSCQEVTQQEKCY